MECFIAAIGHYHNHILNDNILSKFRHSVQISSNAGEDTASADAYIAQW